MEALGSASAGGDVFVNHPGIRVQLKRRRLGGLAPLRLHLGEDSALELGPRKRPDEVSGYGYAAGLARRSAPHLLTRQVNDPQGNSGPPVCWCC